METVAATFDSREAAELAVQEIHALGVPNDRIAVLTPGMSNQQVETEVPTTDTESPGEGKALGGVVGGVMGVAGGASLGAAAASLIIPGVGPVIAAGLLGAAILGGGGTVAGMAVGEALDHSLMEGLPHDELYVYEYALRRGKSVVIAFAENEESAERVRTTFTNLRAESVDEARENWWLELRAAEEAHYNANGGDFKSVEPSYRKGFEAALHPKLRGSDYPTVTTKLQELYGDDCRDDAFRTGYERGCVYHQDVTKTT